MMNNKNLGKNTLTGLGVVAALGMATYFVVNNTHQAKQNKLKKNATKAIKSIGGVVDSFSSMVK